ncbi:uncharacterized protein LOC131933112 [Physella acuta]|uniref:uncharacterized protein LOC131933112 n=1 Tax=Physella acuta TaxID=109671 RepID=UPI0027DBB19A|nr:uncharacterized protein LOC131933112 [Physella acuta]
MAKIIIFCALLLLANIGGVSAQDNSTENDNPTTKDNPPAVTPSAPGGDGTSKTSSTVKTTTTTIDPILAINAAISDIPDSCNSKNGTGFNCKFLVDDITNAESKDKKCSYFKKLENCVNTNCTASTDLTNKVNAMKEICNGASILGVSTMLICFLAVIFRFIEG